VRQQGGRAATGRSSSPQKPTNPTITAPATFVAKTGARVASRSSYRHSHCPHATSSPAQQHTHTHTHTTQRSGPCRRSAAPARHPALRASICGTTSARLLTWPLPAYWQPGSSSSCRRLQGKKAGKQEIRTSRGQRAMCGLAAGTCNTLHPPPNHSPNPSPAPPGRTTHRGSGWRCRGRRRHCRRCRARKRGWRAPAGPAGGVFRVGEFGRGSTRGAGRHRLPS
jgi:hypothetical protein